MRFYFNDIQKKTSVLKSLTLGVFILFSCVYANAQLNIVSTSPTTSAEFVDLDANIVFNFDVAVDAATVNATTIIVMGKQSGIISGLFSGGGSSTITFDPTTDFYPEEEITITLTTGLTNLSGQALVSGHFFSFRSDVQESNYLQTTRLHALNNYSQPYHSTAVDFDQDGDIDMLHTSDVYGGAVLHKNDGNANFSFSTIYNNGTGFDPARTIRAIDFDLDGDLDITFSKWDENSVYIWLRNDGAMNFVVDTLITGMNGYGGIDIADIDGDGDLDVLFSENGGAFNWLENDGNQNFSTHFIAPGPARMHNGQLKDLDQDGDMDILWCVNYSMNWYENDGNQNFTEHIIDASEFQGMKYSIAGDIDNDGDLDLVTTGRSTANISWYQNDGSQNFTKIVIDTDNTVHEQIQLADIDGDNILDIVASARNLTWYRADRKQNFTKHMIFSPNKSIFFDIADIDSDGDLDFAVNYQVFAGADFAGWIEMENMLTTSPAAYARNVPLSSNIVLDFAKDIDGATVNTSNIRVRGELSGSIDGAFTGGGTSTITFNPTSDLLPGEAISVTVSENVLTTDGNPIYGHHSFTFRTEVAPMVPFSSITKHSVSDSLGVNPSSFPSDIDGDGDMDILGGNRTADELVWFENDGSQNYTEILVDAAISPQNVYAIDLDDDGDMDLMSSAEDSLLFWYENNGTENFTKYQFPSQFEGQVINQIYSFQALDIDGDGDLEVSASVAAQGHAWFENDGNENFTAHLVNSPAVGSFHMLNADINGDGDFDVVASGQTPDGLALYNNDEKGNFSLQIIDPTFGSTVESISSNDVDSDGDCDIFTITFFDLLWYENIGSQGFVKHVIETYPVLIDGDLFTMDIDGDSDIDILLSSGHSDTIFLYTNDGNQNFIKQTLYVGDVPSRVFAVDMDGDGDMDVLANDRSTNEAFWLEFSCTPADLPVVTTPAPSCPGPDVTLAWTGSLNDATEWVIRTDSCTGPIMATTTANDIDVNPPVTTTYFIEGGGACGGAGCGSVTVTVYPEYNISETVAVHSGDVVTFPDATTQTIVSDSVIHYSYLTTANGCDSIIQTTVLLTPDTPPNGTCDGALDFDGVNDRVGMGGFYHASNSFTVEFWANIPSTSTPWDHIVENGSVQYDYRGAYRMQVGNEGEVYCAVGNGSTYNDGGYGSGYNLGWEYGEWNHYALTYDGDTVRVFLNGVERISYTTGGLNIMQGDGTLLFSSWKGVDRFYNGILDEVRIWDAARNSAQIVSTMSTQLAGTEPGLLGYWDFNDGYGTQLTDISTFPNHGTLVDMDPLNDWVTVNGDQINLSQSVTICDNDSLVVGNNTHYTTGIYTDTVTNGQGCDSVVVTDLTVLPTYTTALSDVTICSGDSALIFGNYETLTGTYTDTLTALNGCDSVITQTLNVIPSFNETATATICDGDTYMFGTQTLTTAGVYTEVFSAINGCDSTVNLTLNVNPSYNETVTASICDGDNYTFGTQILTTTGAYTEVFSTINGCDSTVNLTLNVNPTYNETVTASICDGDSYTFGTQTLTTAGAYTEAFSTINGCDSIVNLTLNVNPTYNETVIASICDGNSYTFGTQTLTTAGAYTEVFSTINGCDSTVNITLNVNPTYNETVTASICDGDSYTFGTQTLTTAGAYTEVFSTINGCDSIVNLTLNVNPTHNETVTATVCDGDSYTFGTQTLTTAGNYTEVFQSVNGCDSTVVLTLSVNPVYNETATATICDGDSYTFGTQTLTTAGNYTEVFQSMNGCDSTVILTLTVNVVNAGISVSGITLTADVSGATYQWVDCNDGNAPIAGETDQDFTPTANGSYAVEVTENGCTETSTCENITTIGITENELDMSLLIYPNPNSGKFYIELSGTTFGEYTVELFNSMGQIIYSGQMQMNNTHLIELNNTTPGMYTVRVGNEHTETRQRIVVE